VIPREKIGVGENTCKEEVLAFGVSEIVYAMLVDASRDMGCMMFG
jgi:hypothetical protein